MLSNFKLFQTPSDSSSGFSLSSCFAHQVCDRMGGVAWTEEEDQLLRKCVEEFGEGKWHRIPMLAGLNRCRKSCRLRWLNYLRPNIKRGSFTGDEIEIMIEYHKIVGNRWSVIAANLPGRTANDVKNFWNCHLSKTLTAEQMSLHPEEENRPNCSDVLPKRDKEIGTSTSTIRPSAVTDGAHQAIPVDEVGISTSVEEHGTVLGDLHEEFRFDEGEIDGACRSRKWDWDDDLVMDMDIDHLWDNSS